MRSLNMHGIFIFFSRVKDKMDLANFESYTDNTHTETTTHHVWCRGVVIYFDGRCLMIYGKEFLCFDFEF